MGRPRKEVVGLARAPNMIPKARQSEMISEQIADFLAKGRSITQVDVGATGVKENKAEARGVASRGGKAKARGGSRQYREQSYRERIERKGLDTA